MDERTSDAAAASMGGAAPPHNPAGEGAGAPVKVRLGKALILVQVRHSKLLDE